MRPYEEGDPVVLPSGRRAQVVRWFDEDRLELRYLDDERQLVILPAYLVRRIERGLVPPPVRIGARSR